MVLPRNKTKNKLVFQRVVILFLKYIYIAVSDMSHENQSWPITTMQLTKANSFSFPEPIGRAKSYVRVARCLR